MVEKDYISLAATIERHYHAYDGFLVLHGTDTMAYTASALSFLLEDLGKSVIITGSQVPFTELRNDAYENFLGSLILCSHYCIPEVTVYFNNKLFRGNRVKKVNSQAFAAFNSPNMKPLGIMGVDIHVEWGKVARATSLRPFKASNALNSSVVCLRLYPGITETTIKAITSEPVRGLVLETFGSGNAPDDNPSLLAALADAVKRGVVIVNVTQCTTGAAVAGYAVGYALSATGVISGRDMTAECALMKLNYLLSHPDYTQEMVTRLMGESLRGELTTADAVPVGESSPDKVPTTLSSLIMQKSLAACPDSVQDNVDELLRPVLIHDASARGDVAALEELITRDFDINTTNRSTGRTCLYVAMSKNSIETVHWLISKGVNVHLRDNYGVTAVSFHR
jgi:lysophospholipase